MELDALCGAMEAVLFVSGEAVERGDRLLAGVTAPAHGLCLEYVWYPGEAQPGREDARRFIRL